jgi:predicted RNase H-like nuclease
VTVVLGIDAAWTARQPSGVALLRRRREGWSVIVAAPSYASFIGATSVADIDWRAPPAGSAPDPEALLEAARRWAGAEVDLVTVDMPVATEPFSARRTSDAAVTRRFSRHGCATHSPSAARPGPLGRRFSEGFAALGYPVITTASPGIARRGLLEIYPHVALLELLGLSYRFPYKVSRSAQYWPGTPTTTRVRRLLAQYRTIERALAGRLGTIPVPLPRASASLPLAMLKRYEDALDGILAAWVGSLYVEGRAAALGDEVSATWVPRALIEPDAPGPERVERMRPPRR